LEKIEEASRQTIFFDKLRIIDDADGIGAPRHLGALFVEKPLGKLGSGGGKERGEEALFL
jgi:hypothetical protein